jgi:hypothetical protein
LYVFFLCVFFLSLCSYLITYFTCLYYSFPHLLFNFSEVLVIAFFTLFINFHQFTTITENSLKTVARVPVILQSPVSHLRLVCMCLVSLLFFFRLHFNRRSLSESVKFCDSALCCTGISKIHKFFQAYAARNS